MCTHDYVLMLTVGGGRGLLGQGAGEFVLVTIRCAHLRITAHTHIVRSAATQINYKNEILQMGCVSMQWMCMCDRITNQH